MREAGIPTVRQRGTRLQTLKKKTPNFEIDSLSHTLVRMSRSHWSRRSTAYAGSEHERKSASLHELGPSAATPTPSHKAAICSGMLAPDLLLWLGGFEGSPIAERQHLHQGAINAHRRMVARSAGVAAREVR